MEAYFLKNKARIEEYLKAQHFMHYIGFNLNMIEPGRTEGWLDLKPIHQQQKGFAHGGLITTLADIVAGFAAYTLVAPENHVVTAEIKVSFLNPGLGERLHAKGWVLKSGSRMNFCEAEVFSENNKTTLLIAKASATMATVFPADLKIK